jgi:hypothetical protein
MVKYNGTGDGAGVKSYWFISFLSLENGHDYFLLHSTSNAGPQLQTSISLMDITTKTYSGRNWISDGQVSSTTLDSLSPEKLHIYTTTKDLFSEFKAISVDPTYPFNLTHTPRGPNSYQAGAGTYTWGIGRAFAWDNPEALTTGTLTINGTETKVIPEKSMTWMDFQYGPGYASQGWYSFVIVLSNGVKITTMTLLPTDLYPTVSVATIAYLDGHHEVYTVDKDFHAADPWVSAGTNITYYNSYQVNIPAKCTSLNVKLAMEGGELYDPDDQSKGIKIADTFSYFWGTFEGKPVTGWGNAERMAGAYPNSSPTS